MTCGGTSMTFAGRPPHENKKEGLSRLAGHTEMTKRLLGERVSTSPAWNPTMKQKKAQGKFPTRRDGGHTKAG